MTSYRKMRRQARHARRAGMQPMMVINSGDQLPETLAVVLLRWAWRYRSELAPAYAGALLLAAGWWLHAAHRHAWPSWPRSPPWPRALLVIFGAQLGLPAAHRAAVRGHGHAGGWADGWPPQPPPARPRRRCRKPWSSAALVLSVPWWAHRRRRAKVRVERKLEAWPDIARAVGLPGSQVMSAMVDVWGWRARLRLARGQTIADVIGQDSRDRIGARHLPGRGPRLPDPGRPGQPVRTSGAGHRPARRRDPLARPVGDIDHRAHRPGAVRGRHALPGAVPAPSRPGRRHHRLGQERRPERAHGQPGRLP